MTRQQQASYFTFDLKGRRLAVPLAMVEGVAPLGEVVAIPGNSSAVLVGIAYIFGKIMIVIDVAPLIGLGTTGSVQEGAVVQVGKAYFAVKLSSVGAIVGTPSVHRAMQKYGGVVSSVIHNGRDSVYVIDVPNVIEKHVCS